MHSHSFLVGVRVAVARAPYVHLALSPGERSGEHAGVVTHPTRPRGILAGQDVPGARRLVAPAHEARVAPSAADRRRIVNVSTASRNSYPGSRSTTSRVNTTLPASSIRRVALEQLSCNATIPPGATS